MHPHIRSYMSSLLTVLLSTVAPITRVDAQNAGRVVAVNPDATGTPPGGGSRTLTVGGNLVYKEKIQTSAVGSTQILFPDSSTLNVGRNSSVTIDEYVYDPNAGTGKMVASVGKGVLRFVGGQISHTAGVTIQTPVSSLGVRGGSVTIMYPIPPGFGGGDPNLANAKGELVIGHVGVTVISNNTGSVTLQPGYATFVTGPNDPIPPPFKISDLTLSQILSLLTSKPGQTGGAVDLPTDQMATRQGFGGPTTGNLNNPANPPGTDPLGYFSIFNGGSSVAKNKAQGDQTTQTTGGGGGGYR
ncbi:MAG: FecR domain-containing protein [Xanthobacteraceae bacterium]|nr:FecR domain-containing protein [Xanthobacteraceae bacterium]